MNKSEILAYLEEVVGKDYVSNKPEDLFIYSQDPGASLPRPVTQWHLPAASSVSASDITCHPFCS